MTIESAQDSTAQPQDRKVTLVPQSDETKQANTKMKPDHDTVYAQQAADYDRMIQYEDIEQEWRHSVQQVLNKRHYERIIEIGAGTGRFTRVVLADMPNRDWQSGSYVACDASEAMLEQLKHNIWLDVSLGRISAPTAAKLSTHEALHHKLPLADHSADLILAGWTICYGACEGNTSEEQGSLLDRIMSELRRILRPGGCIAIWETLGTGVAAPEVPPGLRTYIRDLEERYGFERTELSTHFRFPSMEEAKQITSWFFGSTACRFLTPESDGSVVLPSYTGLWVWDNDKARQ